MANENANCFHSFKTNEEITSDQEHQLKGCSVLLERIKISPSKIYTETSEITPRKNIRNRRKPKRYEGGLNLSSAKGRTTKQIQSSDEDDVDDDCEQDEQVVSLKPTALFSKDDVDGQELFQFKSRHTKYDLQNKVKSTLCNSPNIIKTPTSKCHMSNISDATPRQVKNMIKKRIIREVESESGDSDFSGGSSDYIPEDDGTDDETASTTSTSNEEQDIEHPKRNNKVQVSRYRDSKMKPKDSEYIVIPDDYFRMHSSRKITTSDHTLTRLKEFSFNEDLNIHVSEEHKTKIMDLNKSYEYLFDRWLYVLSEDFNIVLYGIGSKRSVLQQFQVQKLQQFPCIVINGFFPSLTTKSILETIIIDLLENGHVPSNIGDAVDLIDTQLRENNVDLFLIIHNIDGTMLRNAKAQAMLASISQLNNVHTIATIDHINAPLLWDHSKLSKFKFTWWDVTTFLPYTEETSFETSLMTHRSGALQLSSLRSVYQSLTTNAKGIFNIIIKHQLENQKQSHYQGLPFKILYSKSREQFLVSSDVALRSQLTEFIDHKLVKMKRTYDGSENLIIPIENSLLQQFLEQDNS